MSFSMDDDVQKKLKQAVTAKLAETREHVEKELPEYILSMIVNKKSKAYMNKNLEAFIGGDAEEFCNWCFDIVEKMNESAVPNNVEIILHSDHGSAPANIISKVQEEKQRESVPDRKEEIVRKRKAVDEPTSSSGRHRPIEAPRRDSYRRDSRKDSDRDRGRELEREKEQQIERHIERGRERNRRDRDERDRRSKSRKLSHREKEKKPSTYLSSSDESPDRSRVASKVVANIPSESAPKLSSTVSVKRKARAMGDEKVMKARTNMFMKALSAASQSTSGGEPSRKTRIVEKIVTSDRPNIEDRIVRVRLDVSKPPTKRMKEKMKKMKEANKAEPGKRKHDEIVWDMSTDEEVEDNGAELEIDKILEETRMLKDDDDEPETKRIPTGKSYVHNTEEDLDMKQMKKKIRCSYWPKCTRGDMCLFLHPNAICTLFPKCQFGQKCHYVHPPCKFMGKCTNKSCPYTHGDPEVLKMLANYFPNIPPSAFAPKPSRPRIEIIHPILPDVPLVPPQISGNSGIVCRFAERCANNNCRFDHPKLCRFGDQCINDRCTYFHPPAPKPNMMVKNNMYKWTATKKLIEVESDKPGPSTKLE